MGLKCEDTGTSRPSQGRELKSPNLVSALIRKRIFTQHSIQIDLAQNFITVEEMAANPGDELAHIIRRPFLDQTVDNFHPHGNLPQGFVSR